ncbi:PREDICTED: voltage-dependent calcium channel subunit alpha-2/delta-3 isoform X1 [Polistes canadensis]|uniref:voltage-dependent calcium channel subunit alpha-2/delta-3 isoform X1 n=1 Tax=Polistes canadensis TaxID=91411 RepID=UPI000718CA10|nr:PREDICTED: voltage-dependent calcium channel subunit alpha-2/delta-3 isoform X1 [Polistes canadensis]
MFLRIDRIVRSGILFLLCIESSFQQEEDIPHNEVKNWALKFGVDLWEFGKQVTKMGEIQRNYYKVEPKLNKRDGLVLVREMAAEVKNMMDFKMNAVMRLMENAEQAAVSPPRDANILPKYSSYRYNLFTTDGKKSSDSREIYLNTHHHFDWLAVNVTLSSVLVPGEIDETESDVAAGILWSEYLDPLFINNYESDPSLSWQYYGATSGFLRRFPAITWPPVEGVFGSNKAPPVVLSNPVFRHVYDFRTSNWFVGAANSPKDLAILIDTMGYDSERNQRLISATTKAILDTLGPDDYVNVYRYGETAEEIVQCFKDSLVQASPENIHELNLAMNTLKHEETTKNISAALSTAFEILHKYNRTGQGSQCNQAIILITTDNEAPPTEVIRRYNWPHMPVRLFAYLIGGDKSPELFDMACTNKGYYARITKPEEIKSKVFEYVKVLARPMVLYQHDHPIHWSPAYIGGKSRRYGRENRGQLMTSVTAPILDRRNHTLKRANLLGVVGTDVPVEEIQKLVPPYQLGVNGYSFIVDNNGRVLYHPDLRPLPENTDYEETLKPTYISVDLSEVELAEYDGPSHPLNNSLLLDLRHDMIDQKEGEIGFSVKIHYDDMKRVTIRRHNYFYKPIEGTPFSLGLALPEGYGMIELLAEQEIRHAKVNVTEYFKGSHWKVHPDWVYCEYNSASDKSFISPEDRVLHFLSRTKKPAWKWMSLRPRSPSSHHKQASKPDKDSYYCDKGLLQSLILDAMVTDGFDKRGNSMHKEENTNPIAILMALLHSKGRGRFGVIRSFVATRSGLFRWHEHQQGYDKAEEPWFPDQYSRAMESSWYKRAVDQHSIEPESFVFSVPFDAAEKPNPLVTATHAIFIGKGHKAPAAVVGLQFQHSSLASHFVNITSTCTAGTTGCKKNCGSEELDCYILDNSGFVVISERHEHTGKFFGEIDGTIMDSLVQDRIYRKVTVIDYQGTCSPQESHRSSAPRTTSASILKGTALIGNFIWNLFLSFNVQDIWRTVVAFAKDAAHSMQNDDDLILSDTELEIDSNIDDADELGELHNLESIAPAESTAESVPGKEDFSEIPIAPAIPVSPPTTRATSAHFPARKLRSCEKKTDLYILQPERLNTSGQSNPLKGKLTNCHVTGCERPFSVQKIRHTNLILLVVDTLCPCGNKQLSIEPIEAMTEPGACTARRERLYRRRPPKCINYHPEEMEIKICGGASTQFARSTQIVFLLTTILVVRLA